MENPSTSVVVKLELGHHASLRSEKTPEGFTHDWTVFVRGPDGTNIQHFIDKVVFYLHDDFPKPKRVVKEPPYQVTESGYAGFILPIEVYFKNKEEPKKVRFDYDLYLRMSGPPISNIRCEKLTFQNPVDEFRRKLVKAGGVGALVASGENTGTAATVQTHSTTLGGQDKSEHSSESQKLAGTKVSSFRSQDKKKHSSTKDGAKNPPSTSRASHPFTDIFGTPIKTRKSSPEESAKPKEGNAIIQSSEKNTPVHTKPNKVPTNSHSSSNLQPSKKENKVGRPPKEKSPLKESKDTKHTKSLKHTDKESKQPSSKRQSSPPSHAKHGSDKKRKRTASSSSESNSAAPQAVGAEKKGDTPKTKHRELKAKEKHKSKPAVIDNSVSNHKKEKSKKSSTPKPSKKLAPSDNNVVSPLCQGSQITSDPPCADENSSHAMQPEEKIDTLLVENKEDSILQVDDLNSSPSSSISLSSLPPGGSHGPLATMMAEMEKDLLSPLSSDPGSHSLSNSPVLKEKLDDNHTTNGDVISVSQSTMVECPTKIFKEDLEEELFGKKNDETESISKEKNGDNEQGIKIKKDQTASVKKKREETDGRAQEETKSHVKKGKSDDDKNVDNEDKSSSQVDQAYARELVGLQQKINQLRDREIIQKIVNVIGETGKYDITSSSFDFDLLRLDQMTVQKLQNCFV